MGVMLQISAGAIYLNRGRHTHKYNVDMTQFHRIGLHHKGELMMYALRQGYVQVTPNGIYSRISNGASGRMRPATRNRTRFL